MNAVGRARGTRAAHGCAINRHLPAGARRHISGWSRHEQRLHGGINRVGRDAHAEGARSSDGASSRVCAARRRAVRYAARVPNPFGEDCDGQQDRQGIADTTARALIGYLGEARQQR